MVALTLTTLTKVMILKQIKVAVFATFFLKQAIIKLTPISTKCYTKIYKAMINSINIKEHYNGRRKKKTEI